MDNFEYEFNTKEPRKSGGRALIVILVVILLLAAAFFAGAYFSNNLNLPADRNQDTEISDDSTQAENTEDAESTSDVTPAPSEAAETQTKQPTEAVQAANDIPTIVETVSSGVVSITSYYSSTSDKIDDWEPMSFGTGVIISSDGYIVTNNHVIADAGRISVTLENGEKLVAELIGSDQYVDLAVLKIEKDGLYTIPFGDSSEIRAGEQVIAIGSPLGDELTGTVTAGIISAVNRQIEVDGIPFTLLVG